MKKTVAVLLVTVVALFTIALPASAQENNLIAYYSFDDDTNLGKDYSGNGNDLTAVGAGVISSEGVTQKALHLDGESGLVAKSSSGIDFTDSLNSFTISFYAKAEGDVGINSRICSSGYNGTQDGFNISLARQMADQVLIVYQPIIGDKKDHWGVIANDSMILGDAIKGWNQYVAVYNSDTRTMSSYINGELKAEDHYDAPVLQSSLVFCVGGSWGEWFSNVMEGFEGSIDELKIYNTALTDLSIVGIKSEDSSYDNVTDESIVSEEKTPSESNDSNENDSSTTVAENNNEESDGNHVWYFIVGGVLIIGIAVAGIVLLKKSKNKSN